MSIELYQPLIEAIVQGDQEKALSETKQIIQLKNSAKNIINAIEKAMIKLNFKCTAEQFNLLEIMLSGRAVTTVTNYIFPEGKIEIENPKGKVLIASLEGDIHDLGKNIVKMVLTGNSYQVIDCGKNVSIDRILTTVKDEGCQAICISGLISSIIPKLIQLKDELKIRQLQDIPILAGGAALKQCSKEELNVDFVGETAFDAPTFLNEILG